MPEITIVVEHDPSEEQDAIITHNLFKYENEELIKEIPQHASIYLEDENKNIVGGVLIWIHKESIYIPTLWIDENLRKKGYGKKLLAAAEDEGIKNNCLYSTLDCNFASVSFYLKQGYYIIGEIQNYIQNHTKFYLRKNIRENDRFILK